MATVNDLVAAVADLKRADADNVRLRAALKGIAEYCSGDDPSRGATARLAAVGNTAEQALRALEQRGARK